MTADTSPDNGVKDAIKYAINNNVAPILITSFGECENNLAAGEYSADTALFAQAASQGMTIVAPSGDGGAAACDTGTVAQNGLWVDFPASSQYVTAIGGTAFTATGTGTYFGSTNDSAGGSAQSYIPEIAWNDGNLAASGGGVSKLTAKPTWQTGTGRTERRAARCSRSGACGFQQTKRVNRLQQRQLHQRIREREFRSDSDGRNVRRTGDTRRRVGSLGPKDGQPGWLTQSQPLFAGFHLCQCFS